MQGQTYASLHYRTWYQENLQYVQNKSYVNLHSIAVLFLLIILIMNIAKENVHGTSYRFYPSKGKGSSGTTGLIDTCYVKAYNHCIF